MDFNKIIIIILGSLILFLLNGFLFKYVEKSKRSQNEQDKIKNILNYLWGESTYPKTLSLNGFGWIFYTIMFLFGPAMSIYLQITIPADDPVFKGTPFDRFMIEYVMLIIALPLAMLVIHVIYIRSLILTKNSITIRPTLLHVLRIRYFDREIPYNEIEKIKIMRSSRDLRNHIIQITTAAGIRKKIHTSTYEDGVGEALYLYLKRRADKISEKEMKAIMDGNLLGVGGY